jgi:hypothetical protein
MKMQPQLQHLSFDMKQNLLGNFPNIKLCYDNIIHNKVEKLNTNIDYDIWIKMKSRCFNKNDKSYKHYGARGILVCDEWVSSFENFINDLGWRPSKDYSLERIDYNKDYCPENCKWILKSEQSKNSRRVNLFSYKGKEYCLTDFCKEFSFPYSTMRHRVYDLGIPIEEAIKYPQHYKFRKK